MKVLFLDIDGVANSDKFIEECRKTQKNAINWIDPIAIQRLNKILKETNAKVVISSSWRLEFKGHTRLHDHLKKFGFEGEIIGSTPYLGGPRGIEIQRWLDKNKNLNIEKFIILDDNSDMEHLIRNLVQTSFEYGLQDQHVDFIIKELS